MLVELKTGDGEGEAKVEAINEEAMELETDILESLDLPSLVNLMNIQTSVCACVLGLEITVIVMGP
jgi:hypothetical protein